MMDGVMGGSFHNNGMRFEGLDNSIALASGRDRIPISSSVRTIRTPFHYLKSSCLCHVRTGLKLWGNFDFSCS